MLVIRPIKRIPLCYVTPPWLIFPLVLQWPIRRKGASARHILNQTRRFPANARSDRVATTRSTRVAVCAPGIAVERYNILSTRPEGPVESSTQQTMVSRCVQAWLVPLGPLPLHFPFPSTRAQSSATLLSPYTSASCSPRANPADAATYRRTAASVRVSSRSTPP